MKTVAIIGVGLIGGSLGMALRCVPGKKYRVVGLGRDARKLRYARRRAAVDDFSTDWQKGVGDADIVVMGLPVDQIPAGIARILPHVKEGAVITDVGGVKGSVLAEVRRTMAGVPHARASFVGAHPMAGSEKNGVAFAQEDLFAGAAVVLVKDRLTPVSALAAVRRMWEDVRAETVVMSAAEHDRAVAVTSHLPHLIAFNLCRSAGELQKADPHLSRLIAGSFRDLTRVADSNPRDWAAICSGNREALCRALDTFIRRLRMTRRLLGDRTRLERELRTAHGVRKKLLTGV
jgi:prephenate dehydrogenase